MIPSIIGQFFSANNELRASLRGVADQLVWACQVAWQGISQAKEVHHMIIFTLLVICHFKPHHCCEVKTLFSLGSCWQCHFYTGHTIKTKKADQLFIRNSIKLCASLVVVSWFVFMNILDISLIVIVSLIIGVWLLIIRYTLCKRLIHH